MEDKELLHYMANCIRRYCEEQIMCDNCPFIDDSGMCGLRGYPAGWNGYEEKTEFAISAVAKKETVQTCGNCEHEYCGQCDLKLGFAENCANFKDKMKQIELMEE